MELSFFLLVAKYDHPEGALRLFLFPLKVPFGAEQRSAVDLLAGGKEVQKM